MFSTSLYAEWIHITNSENGDVYFVDDERLKKIDGYIHFWLLRDFPKEDEFGDKSNKAYLQLDCDYPRLRTLSFISNSESMGKGEVTTMKDFKEEDLEWIYPPPKSNFDLVANFLCIAYTNDLFPE